MTIVGTVRNGQIELAEGVRLPEGAEVAVRVLRTQADQPATEGGKERNASPQPDTDEAEPIDGYALNRALLKFAGTITDMPEDSSVNVDHYLYGVPKVE